MAFARLWERTSRALCGPMSPITIQPACLSTSGLLGPKGLKRAMLNTFGSSFMAQLRTLSPLTFRRLGVQPRPSP
eukprot:11178156-Lingulodinium_polyedra.AAC.1